jgi:hypothetical protein
MTSVRLLTAAVLFCTALAFSQEQPSSGIRRKRTAEPDKSVQATIPVDPQEITQIRIDPSGRAFRWGSQIDPMNVRSYGEPGADTVCLKIRSYVVARDDRDSDSVHLVGYSTCQPASRYRLRKTQLPTDPSDR